MKHFVFFLLIIALFTVYVSGCGQSNVPQAPVDASPEPAPVQETTPEPASTPEPVAEPDSEPVVTGESLSIAATIFPQYDWVYQILGDKAEFKDISLILNSRVDLHSFQPSPRDIATISTSDLFIYVGGESDNWVEAVLEQALNPDMIVINLLELLGDEALIDEEIDDGQHHHHHHGDVELDEHVWLSLRNAEIFTSAISEALSKLDPELSDVYKTNAESYIEQLMALDTLYKEAMSGANGDTLLFADRFPFRYLINDYNLNFYAAFSGCSAETEASVQTIGFLVRRVNELGLSTIMVTESANIRIAETVISNSADGNQNILVLDSMQSSNSDDRASGVTYLTIMESNLRVLREALG